MEALRQLINNEERYNELVMKITTIITNNYNVESMYVIDTIQVLINRMTNTFLVYSECEEIYDAIKNNLC